MLKYIWMVIQDLFLTVTFATLIHEVLRSRFGKKAAGIHRTGIVLGVVCAITLAIVKYNTNKIVSSRWNHKIYICLIGLTLLFAVLILLFGRKPGREWGSGHLFTSLAGAGVTAVWIFYTLSGAIVYPFILNLMGNSYISSFFILRLVGWLSGYLILFLYAILLSHCVRLMRNQSLVLAVLLADLLSNAGYCLCRFFVPWVNKAKWLDWPVAYDRQRFGWAMAMVRFSSKHAMTFLWATAALTALLVAVFFSENVKITEPYDNRAQLRKLKARGRKKRRLAAWQLLFLGLSVLSLTVVKAYDTREVVLSAPETFTVTEDRVLVPMEAVNDGHLHRFEYRTENGVDVRWIVVKKPGSASYGVGLDACEVCGNAGYYERNGQVICKRCDVVMNINTIGFKGGCNPIPLAYEVEDGNLAFALEDLIAGEREFK